MFKKKQHFIFNSIPHEQQFFFNDYIILGSKIYLITTNYTIISMNIDTNYMFVNKLNIDTKKYDNINIIMGSSGFLWDDISFKQFI